MRKLLLISLSVFCFIGGYAQTKGTVSKRSVEKSSTKSKTTYSYFLLDQMKAVDDVYTAFVVDTRAFWNKEPDCDLSKLVDERVLQITQIRSTVNLSPVYIGGDDYRESVIDYIEAVSLKVKTLYGYAIIDPNTQAEEYDEAMKVFDEATDVAMEKRNKLKEVKNIYEKTFYIEK